MRHIRQANICSDGARKFFKRYDLDWSDFLANGIEAEKLEATGEAQALEVVEIARG